MGRSLALDRNGGDQLFHQAKPRGVKNAIVPVGVSCNVEGILCVEFYGVLSLGITQVTAGISEDRRTS
jgi:hypothetical protein